MKNSFIEHLEEIRGHMRSFSYTESLIFFVSQMDLILFQSFYRQDVLQWYLFFCAFINCEEIHNSTMPFGVL